MARTGMLNRRDYPSLIRNHYNWLLHDPDYAAAYEEAKRLCGDALEREGLRRAFAGSDTMLIFMLKGAMPDKYTPRYQVEHKGAVELLHKLAQLPSMSDQDLDQLAIEVQDYVRER